MLAFTDSTAVANDLLTQSGETSIIAFRAGGLQNAADTTYTAYQKPG